MRWWVQRGQAILVCSEQHSNGGLFNPEAFCRGCGGPAVDQLRECGVGRREDGVERPLAVKRASGQRIGGAHGEVAVRKLRGSRGSLRADLDWFGAGGSQASASVVAPPCHCWLVDDSKQKHRYACGDMVFARAKAASRRNVAGCRLEQMPYRLKGMLRMIAKSYGQGEA